MLLMSDIPLWPMGPWRGRWLDRLCGVWVISLDLQVELLVASIWRSGLVWERKLHLLQIETDMATMTPPPLRALLD